MERYEYMLTVGLNDKDTEKQIIKTEDAKNIIADILINKYELYAFTMWDCQGVYKMESTGNIVRENSIRIEIVRDDTLNYIFPIIDDIKKALNQESVMLSEQPKNIMFA